MWNLIAASLLLFSSMNTSMQCWSMRWTSWGTVWSWEENSSCNRTTTLTTFQSTSVSAWSRCPPTCTTKVMFTSSDVITMKMCTYLPLMNWYVSELFNNSDNWNPRSKPISQTFSICVAHGCASVSGEGFELINCNSLDHPYHTLT